MMLTTWSAFAFGFAIVAVLGILHHYALLAISRGAPDPEKSPQGKIIVTFPGLLALHAVEIIALAALNLWLFGASWTLDPNGASTWGDMLYLTGINFTTLGYTQIKLDGAMRLVTMLQSLGGFMLLTWSATFLFSACQKSWQQSDG